MNVEKCPKCRAEQNKNNEKCEQCGYTENNLISTILQITAYAILLIGIIGSFVIAIKNPIEINFGQKIFNIKLLCIFLVPSITSGLLLMGISEIIILNQKIFSLLRK